MIQLEEGENIIFESRRHWFVISTTGAFLFFLAIAPFIMVSASLIIYSDFVSVVFQPKYLSALLLLGSSWLLVVWILFFVSWTDYYLDVLVITNKRLVDVEQKGLFRRDIATIPLSNVQDIKVEIKGLIRTLLKFGDLYVQTAGFSQELKIRDIHSPEKVKQIIMSAYHAHKTLN